MDLIEAKQNFERSSRHPWENARLKTIIHLFSRELENANNENGYILDLGCGDAWLINQLSQLYPNIQFVGIDIFFEGEDIKDLKELYQNSNLNLFKTLDDFHTAFEEIRFHAALMLDVVEHVEDDRAFIQELIESNTIDRDTKILVTVPAYQSLFSSHDHYMKHFRRYTRNTLGTLFMDLGITVERSSYFFFSLWLSRWFFVKFMDSETTKENTALAKWDKSRFITSLITGVLLLDSKIGLLVNRIGLGLPGLSVFAKGQLADR
ncbi:class I SAM-dependent methyltransferase [Bacteroidia bacterium]|jgi:SAM-dependent methyltransferase|nr:class I SAM-dependent methyltransferase [Bacteroidia bacterium]MDA8629426.1 class I SAM-dependent methyltransferase [Bacteroidia bacterium]MDA9213696.1 class I SAM-dependent methyltransferase [Bacteroidia bacterium]